MTRNSSALFWMAIARSRESLAMLLLLSSMIGRASAITSRVRSTAFRVASSSTVCAATHAGIAADSARIIITAVNFFIFPFSITVSPFKAFERINGYARYMPRMTAKLTLIYQRVALSALPPRPSKCTSGYTNIEHSRTHLERVDRAWSSAQESPPGSFSPSPCFSILL